MRVQTPCLDGFATFIQAVEELCVALSKATVEWDKKREEMKAERAPRHEKAMAAIMQERLAKFEEIDRAAEAEIRDFEPQV
eukprot:m.108981 g.108981  ORF g.108981 m.108981 type:complete len:81 (-) comp16952_c0_seq3:180-422(-)